MYSQFVLIEFHNSVPYLLKFTSQSKVTIDEVATYMIEKEGFDEEVDAVTFVGNPDIVVLKG